MIDISFLSPDPAAGAHFLNSLTQELADYTVERSWRITQHKQEWMRRQLDDLRDRWEHSEQRLTEYSQTSGVTLERGSDSVNAPKVTSSSPTPDQTAMRPASRAKLKLLKNRLAILHTEVAEWEPLYGASNPAVLKLRSQIAAVNAAIRQLGVGVIGDTSPSAPTGLPPVISGPAQPALKSPEHLAHLKILQEESDKNRRIYEAAVTRLEEANISNESPVGDFSVVDPAIAESKPVSPNQLLNGMLGAFVGLLLGTAFIGLRDRCSSTFNDPTLIDKLLGLQVLGAIPTTLTSQLPKNILRDLEEPALHLAFEDDLDTAEAYRSIRSSILCKVTQVSGPRRLVFVSAGGSEGKTTVIGNLGAALASARRRVLLVDGDLRNPGLHKVFGASNDHGLTELLGRQIANQPATSREIIRETQVPNLYLLSAGQAGANAPEILASIHLPLLLEELAKTFDLVLIDSPAVLPYSDARILAHAADAVVLVIRAGVTNRHSALLCRDTILRDAIPILGSILTDWDKSQSAYA